MKKETAQELGEEMLNAVTGGTEESLLLPDNAAVSGSAGSTCYSAMFQTVGAIQFTGAVSGEAEGNGVPGMFADNAAQTGK